MHLPPTISPWIAGGPPPNPHVGLSVIGEPAWWWYLSAASSAASAYHGYRRHAGSHPIAWAGLWGLLGAALPVITPAVAVAQGFGRRK